MKRFLFISGIFFIPYFICFHTIAQDRNSDPSHFVKVWTGSGTDHMNINVVSAKLDNLDLDAGDEIGIFDGNLCVGASILTGVISQSNILTMVISGNDGSGNGYTAGHNITYRVYDKSKDLEVALVIPEYFTNNPGWSSDGKFSIGATAFVKLSASGFVNHTPIANAGPDQVVNERTTVTLDGTSSADADGNPLTYKWTAPAGIILSSSTASKPTFAAPDVEKITQNIFALIMNDGIIDSQPDTVIITIKPVFNTSENLAICTGQSYNGWTTSGTYQRKLESKSGCDSVVTTVLTVNPIYNITENKTICQGQNYQGWTASGTYQRTLKTKLGCDSLVTTILKVNPIQNVSENKSICTGQNYNGWTSSGSFKRTLQSKSGCDSIVTTNLTVNPSYNITENKNICQGQNYNGWTTSGTYQRKLQSKTSCDSTVNTVLKVNPIYNIKENKYICQGESYNDWNTSGSYARTLQSTSGCDSIVSTDLTVFPSFNPIIIAHGDTLQAIRQYKSYQWLNESGVIAGATSEKYVISKSGKYYMVIKDENGCTNTSEVYNTIYSNVRISAFENFKYSIIPNPNKGQFTFRMDSDSRKDLILKLLNPIGQVIEIRPVKSAGINHLEQFNVSYLSKGIYFLNISSEQNLKTEKIIVQ